MAEFKYQPLAPIPSKKLIEGAEELNFIRPDGPSRCTWRPGLDLKSSPHVFQPHNDRPKILPNVLHVVGNTPLIRLNNIPKSLGIRCEVCGLPVYYVHYFGLLHVMFTYNSQ